MWLIIPSKFLLSSWNVVFHTEAFALSFQDDQCTSSTSNDAILVSFALTAVECMAYLWLHLDESIALGPTMPCCNCTTVIWFCKLCIWRHALSDYWFRCISVTVLLDNHERSPPAKCGKNSRPMRYRNLPIRHFLVVCYLPGFHLFLCDSPFRYRHACLRILVWLYLIGSFSLPQAWIGLTFAFHLVRNRDFRAFCSSASVILPMMESQSGGGSVDQFTDVFNILTAVLWNICS